MAGIIPQRIIGYNRGMKTTRFLLAFVLILTLACSTLTPSAPAAESQPTSIASASDQPASPTPAQTLPQTWTRSNPGGGGAFSSIGAGPTGIIMAGSDLSGAYISYNRGASWSVIGYANGLLSTHVAGLGFDPLDENILYVGTDAGLFRSEDGGKSVQRVIEAGYVSNISFSRLNPLVGYAARHEDWNVPTAQIYKSTDRGETWAQISVNLPGNLRVTKLIVNPQNENILYLLSGYSRFACGANGIFKSEDGGVTWRDITLDMPDVEDFALNKINPDILYFTTPAYVPDETCESPSSETGKLYQSVDSGESWTKIADKSGSIWADGDGATIRLIASYLLDWDERAGTWESVDNGQSWSKVGDIAVWEKGWSNTVSWTFGSNPDGSSRTFGEDLSDPESLLWVNWQFAWVSRDRGRTFDNINSNEVAPGQWQSTGFDNIVMFDLAIGANPQDIYTGSYDIGCWHSPDNGLSWMNCNDAATTTIQYPDYVGGWAGSGGNTTTILPDPARENVVWSAQSNDLTEPHILLRSNDKGATWEESNGGLPQIDISGLSVDRNSPLENRTLFVAADGDVYSSADDGHTWSLALDCNGCWFTAVDNFDGNLVYAGGHAGLFVSEAGGMPGSWKQVEGFEGSGANPYGWDVWSGVHRIVPDSVTAGKVYAAFYGEGGGLFVSVDRGAMWAKLLDDDFMKSVAVSPADPNILYATSSSNTCCGGDPTVSRGILRSTDGGETWVEVNEGMAWNFAAPITIHPSNPILVWVGSPGTGFQWRVFAE